MAFSKITTRGMSGDTLEAGDIAPNAIGASELADNAVDTDAIAATSITEAKLNADVTDGSAIQTPSKPHIQPGLLYPAYQGYLGEIDNVGAIADTSTSAHQITNIDNYTVATSGQKTGTGYLDTNATTGSGGSHLTIGSDNTPDFQFGTGAFTIEYWVKEDDYDYGDHGHFTTSQGAVGWAIQRASTYLYFTAQGDAYGSAPTSGNKIVARANLSGHVSDNTWYHVAIVRVSTSNLKIYINGTDRTAEADAGGTYGWGWNNTSNDYNLVLGRSYPTSEEKHTAGGFDDIRITKGLAVYTGNFTAPASTLTTTWSAGTNIAANTDGSKVKLLMTSDHSTVTSTQHSGVYGTAQSDGRKYYYTDIKGSKPIKDPRIGAHFGSQRHTCTSLQVLDQETALNDKKNIYSIDGREWMRGIQGNGETLEVQNNNNGCRVVGNGANVALEFTGYFRNVHFINQTYASDTRSFTVTLDGTTGSEVNTFNTTTTPLAGRYVDCGSVLDLGLSTTLGIHTVKIQCHSSSDWINFHGFELIAQDTTDTASKSKIQIPAQNVVAYGKKFALSAAAHHYDPFNGMSGAKTLSQLGDYIDTATSLGMDNWKGGTSNYYRPFNGGRVVKWVASDGTIKTSVTMIPPNAQNIDGVPYDSTSDSDVQAGSNNEVINFNGKAIDHSLSEAAKTYHIREFGNGNANGGPTGTYQDASMRNISGTGDCAYVLDDGLTSHSGDDLEWQSPNDACHFLSASGANDGHYFTFIGSGVSIKGRLSNAPTVQHWAQNLPYGSHVIRIQGVNDVEEVKVTLDGVVLNSSKTYMQYAGVQEITFHQPKMPKVPEDACIIADYMLMADFVREPTPSTVADYDRLSKGVRLQSTSRDFLANVVDGFLGIYAPEYAGPTGYYLGSNGTASSNASNSKFQLCAFGTNFIATAYSATTRNDVFIDGSGVAHSGTTVGNHADIIYPNSAVVLGSHTFALHGVNSTAYSPYLSGKSFQIVTPIHTSSHYQEFETPFLKVLIGGDRNMEQTNLVVTSDGKTWDEVTRDTSYIGSAMVASEHSAEQADNYTIKFDIWRGDHTGGSGGVRQMYNKDFAIAYDRVICLKEGQYRVYFKTVVSAGISGSQWGYMRLNGSNVGNWWMQDENYMNASQSRMFNLKRGDYIQILSFTRAQWSDIFQIHRV